MKKTITLLLLAAGITCGVAKPMHNTVKGSTLNHKVQNIDYHIGMGYHSAYIFEGTKVSGRDLITQTFELHKTFSHFEVAYELWHGSTNGPDGINELDHALAITKRLGENTTLTVEYIIYDDLDSSEYEDEVALVWVQGLKYFDLLVEYAYIVQEEEHEVIVEAAVNLPSFYNDKINSNLAVGALYSLNSGQFNYGYARLTFSYQLTETAVVEPYIAATLAGSGLPDEKNYLFGGVTMTVSF